MPFDANAPVEVSARDRVIQLRNFIADLPDEKFNIARVFSAESFISHLEDFKACGTAACILGWAEVLFDIPDEFLIHNLLGLSPWEARILFMPVGYSENPEQFPRSRAVRTLDHFISTGEIDWYA